MGRAVHDCGSGGPRDKASRSSQEALLHWAHSPKLGAARQPTHGPLFARSYKALVPKRVVVRATVSPPRQANGFQVHRCVLWWYA